MCTRIGQVVPGLLFKVTDQGWKTLDAKEGAPSAYDRRNVETLTADGQVHSATTYCVVEPRRGNWIAETCNGAGARICRDGPQGIRSS